MSTRIKTGVIALLFTLAAPLGAAADETIKHEPIKKFDMDAMTMVFRAGDPAMLKQVKPGDKVQFHPDKVNGQFTVTKIEKAK
jgi:Cu/Ag efflux protein CusF